MKEIPGKSVRLIILDPGHFHAALMQKQRIAGVEDTVEVFAPDGADVYGYFSLIESYNTREKDPTSWKIISYTGEDYLQQMLRKKTGNLVVLAGNNRKKAEYIKASVQAGLDVLSDKPMTISEGGLNELNESFAIARGNGNFIYDVMTSRYEWFNIVIAHLLNRETLGKVKTGSTTDPAIILHSTHYYFKLVSGMVLVRPPWYFDIAQQGAGIVDITTHLTDLVQWFTQPLQQLNANDVHVAEAKQWPTLLPKDAFFEITQQKEIPAYLSSAVHQDSISVLANGSFTYSLKGIFAKISVEWKFKAPDGEGDAYMATIRCADATIKVIQDKAHNFMPALVIEPSDPKNKSVARALEHEIKQLAGIFPGIRMNITDGNYGIMVPDNEKLSHEDQFAQVVKQFLKYRSDGKIPEWERDFMLTKYYTLQRALKLSLSAT